MVVAVASVVVLCAGLVRPYRLLWLARPWRAVVVASGGRVGGGLRLQSSPVDDVGHSVGCVLFLHPLVGVSYVLVDVGAAMLVSS